MNFITNRKLTIMEQKLLKLPAAGQVQPRRALLGASYSAVMALQILLHASRKVDRPTPPIFSEYVLGSPSVSFDPEILPRLRSGE